MVDNPNITRGGDVRIFVQEATTPGSPYTYYGCMMLGGPEQSQGEPTPIYCPSPVQRNAWDIVDEAPTVQELGTTDFTQRMDRYLRDAWWRLKRNKSVFNIQAVLGRCQAPDDFTQWDSKILLSSSRLTNFTLPELGLLEGGDNTALDLGGSFSFRDLVPIKKIKFSEKGDTVILAEVLDGLYNDFIQNGECGQISDGLQRAYFLTLANGGSPGLSSQIVYTDDGGATMAALDIALMGGLSGTALEAVGNKLVIISQARNSHIYALFSDIDSGSGNFTEVTDGYVSTKGPRAIYSKNASQTFIAAAGGYVYRMDDPTLEVAVISDGSVSTQDLNAIDGYGSVIVAVGGSNAILSSENDGESFSLVTGPQAGVAINAVQVLSNTVWIIGYANGRMYFTVDAGETWTRLALPANISIINDIDFYDATVGYMAAQAAGVAVVYRTTDGGRSWHNTAPHISGLPTAERINFVYAADHNVVAAGGRVSSGGDGILAIAE